MPSVTGVATDDKYDYSESVQLIHTLLANFVIFGFLMLIFEFVRRKRSIYINRYVARFINTNRVPDKPSKVPLAWVLQILRISDEASLSMIGLDAYMFLRFISVCFRTAGFCSVWGLIILVPVYRYQGLDKDGWFGYTIGNISLDDHSNRMYAPVFSAYVFTGFFCYLLYTEYKAFIRKRVDYLVKGDQDTPVQTNYTVMIERVPAALRSGPILAGFFQNLFPGEFHSAEVALDLHELELLCAKRRETRNRLEKYIAQCWAYDTRPTVWINRKLYQDQELRPEPVEDNVLAKDLGYDVVDAIKHYSRKLITLNESVRTLQKHYFEQRKRLNQLDEYRVLKIKQSLEASSAELVSQVGSRFQTLMSFEISPFHSDKQKQEATLHEYVKKMEEDEIKEGDQGEAKMTEQELEMALANSVIDDDGDESLAAKASKLFATESKKTAEYAAKGALRGVLEATRAIELLTFGARYRVSSTAFVTFKSRVAKCSAHQMLLSHEYYSIDVKPAPNPKEIIWENVSIPQTQIDIRRIIADGTFGVGALFWSIVVTAISTVSNLEMIGQMFPGISNYKDTQLYQLVNNYLSLLFLLILLAVLPFLFDFIARYYEGAKTETEIQNSIMTRYFYYQLANVFVAVGLGSIASSLQKIASNPNNILAILGTSIPSFSIYFAKLVILRAFTALPVEMLRVFPLLDILFVSVLKSKNAITRRELRSGAFFDPPMLYGWCYPNILMVLTIMFTYCCISPLIIPLCMIYFGMVYLMYKYQLLFVYINSYQSGGYMWFAVFNRAMICLIAGIFSLLCYLLIRSNYTIGPFYLLLPLPFFVFYFWYHCEHRIRGPSQNLSLEAAIHLDQAVKDAKLRGERTPLDSFNPIFFRQPVLSEGKLKPSLYRHNKAMLPDIAVSDEFSGGAAVGYRTGLRYHEVDKEETMSPLHSMAHSLGSISSGKAVEDKVIKDKLSNSPGKPASDPRPRANTSSEEGLTRNRRGSLEGFEVDEDFDKEEYERDLDEAVNRYLESDKGFFFTPAKNNFFKQLEATFQSPSKANYGSRVADADGNEHDIEDSRTVQVVSPFHVGNMTTTSNKSQVLRSKIANSKISVAEDLRAGSGGNNYGTAGIKTSDLNI